MPSKELPDFRQSLSEAVTFLGGKKQVFLRKWGGLLPINILRIEIQTKEFNPDLTLVKSPFNGLITWIFLNGLIIFLKLRSMEIIFVVEGCPRCQGFFTRKRWLSEPSLIFYRIWCLQYCSSQCLHCYFMNFRVPICELLKKVCRTTSHFFKRCTFWTQWYFLHIWENVCFPLIWRRQIWQDNWNWNLALYDCHV